MNKLKIINENILKSEKFGIIIHAVSVKMQNSGLTKQLCSKYPKLRDNLNLHKEHINFRDMIYTKVDDYLAILSLVCVDVVQTGRYKSNFNSLAFLKQLNEINDLHLLNPDVEFHMCYNIGSGLAGGLKDQAKKWLGDKKFDSLRSVMYLYKR